jgi:hypothetical protein
MSEINPFAMLQLYRERSAPFDDEQVRLFRKMPDKDRDELVFRMALSLGGIMSEIRAGKHADNMDDARRNARGGDA